MVYKIKQLRKIKGSLALPADKSISHRALMLSAISEGKTVIKDFLDSDDTRATINCLKKLGVKIKQKNKALIVEGKGKYFSKNKKIRLFANESGTTIRILSGLLAAQKFPVKFDAAEALRKRPMGRIILPLAGMGANIKSQNRYPPLEFKPAKEIKSANLKLAIASAQVKSAVMLAALYADKSTLVSEPYQSRDHSERMFKLFGVDVKRNSKGISIKPPAGLVSPKKIFIPSDFSSAAFFIVLGLILKQSKITLRKVNINPTRCGLLKVLKRMNAKISFKNKQNYYEPYSDIVVESSELKATRVNADEIPSLIDEVPILSVAAAFAKGRTRIDGLRELRVKETDRIKSISYNLKAAGIKLKVFHQALEIEAAKVFKKASFKSFGDHRTAMSAIILGSAIGGCSVDNIKCINKSFPGFIALIKSS